MRTEIERVKIAKLVIIPSEMPSGRLIPFPFTLADRTIGNNGQMQGDKIVTTPDTKAKPSNNTIYKALRFISSLSVGSIISTESERLLCRLLIHL